MFYFDESEPSKKDCSSKKEGVVKSCGNHLKVSAPRVNKMSQMLPFPLPSPLNSFSAYDKCESLLQFPRIFIACFNTGDKGSMEKLLRSRTDRKCEVNLLGKTMDLNTYLKAIELVTELYPDAVTLTNRSVSVGNQISTVLCFKYTASRTIENSLKKREPALIKLCPSLHTDPTQLNEFIASRPVEDRPAILTEVYMAEELVVYGKSLLSVTFEDNSRKIVRIDLTCLSTSFEAK